MARDRDDDRFDDDRPRRPRRDDEDEDDRPRRRPRRDDDDFDPPPKSNTGKTLLIVFGILAAVSIPCVAVLIGLLLPAVQKVREAAGRQVASNNGKQIALAAHNIDSATAQLPTPFLSRDESGWPFDPPAAPNDRLSWRVGFLPYIEQDNVYRQFRLKEAWNSPANQPLAGTPVKPYLDPLDPAGSADTRYRCFYDNGALFESDPKARVTFSGITDGSSNTIMYVESTDRVVWTQFNDFRFDPSGPLPSLGHPNRTLFLAVMADGSTKWVSKTINPQTLKAAITKAGNEPLGADW